LSREQQPTTTHNQHFTMVGAVALACALRPCSLVRPFRFAMASTATKPSILNQYPHLRKEIQKVQQEVLGYAPPSMGGMRTGHQSAKKQLTAVYLNQYYDANPSIDPFARQVSRTLWRGHHIPVHFSLLWRIPLTFVYRSLSQGDPRMEE
jgi:hypothetical protein